MSVVLKLTGEMREIELKKCPICNCVITGYPAISRRDNKTEICSDCGLAEAMEDYFKFKGE